MRKVYTWLFLVLILLLLVVPASAHSGRTDGRGGHNGPGGYHYHHGYPAHDHGDMNGDGVIDCPYDFDNKTGANSGGNDGDSLVSGTQNNQGSYAGSTSKKSNIDVHPVLLIALSAFIGYWALKLVRQHKERKAQEAENTAILDNLGIVDVKIPRGVSLMPDGTPTIGDVSDFRPFGDYTVYIAVKGCRYHKRMSCCKTGVAHHLFKLPPNVTPCQICAKGMDVRPEVPMWYRQIENKSK